MGYNVACRLNLQIYQTMIYIVESLSLKRFVPLVKTNDARLAKEAQACIQKLVPNSRINIVFGSCDQDDVPFAEGYSWK